MEESKIVKALAALAQSHRLRIFRALVMAGEQGLTPGQMSEQLAVAATTLSFHLKELIHADLVSQQRQGRSLIYRANYQQMQQLLSYLTDNCCQGEPCLSPSNPCSSLM